MNEISFLIKPCADTNDHEVRIIIDGEDFLKPDALGIDPPDFFGKLVEGSVGELLVGRCGCGTVGCDDVSVFVSKDGNVIRWKTFDNLNFEFNQSDYTQSINNLITDNSWEDVNRRVERLLSNLFKDTKTDDGLVFCWASARIKKNVIYLSYSQNLEQRLLEFSWDGASEESALKQGRIYKRERFE